MRTRRIRRETPAAPWRSPGAAGGLCAGLAAMVLALVAVLLIPPPARAQSGTVRPAAARGTTLVPDHFLRRWDPVTVFFTRAVGPPDGGPEDAAGRWVRFTPDHPGAFTWLDERTLQFRPAEPWPPLARFTWTAGGESFQLTTLMAPPVATLPRSGQEGLEAVEAITLSFAEPLEPGALARAVTLELRPLPGIGGDGARWLTRDDFDVKVMDRHSREEAATYVLQLHHPVPLGTRAIVHLRLSLDDEAPESFMELDFRTAEPFRPVAFGCFRNRYPVTPEGSLYSRDEAIRCDDDNLAVVVDFSSPPRALGPVEARNLVRLTPPVGSLEVRLADRRLEVRGDFARETLYRLALVPTPLTDVEGRPLDLRGGSELFLYFPARPPYLRWSAGAGVAERLGPQRVPVEGRGQRRLDLRLHPLDPLDRSFWPFPGEPVTVDEARRPPGPGEEPAPFTAAEGQVSSEQIGHQIAALGSPPVSTLVELPLTRQGGAASFGLDLAPHLATLAGRQRPGTYLVGMRRLDGSTERSWMRLQVTDLSLTTVEEPRRVLFAVTSLATGEPVAGATVRVEGTVYPRRGAAEWVTLFSGTSDGEGRLLWDAPGRDPNRRAQVRRIVVEKAGDTLVLDAARPPDAYADNHWAESRGSWLQWTVETLASRGPRSQRLSHLFTDRPVYRPEEAVHIKGYLRQRVDGRLRPLLRAGALVVSGPGDLEWRYPLTPTGSGSIYHRFAEEKLPSGTYRAAFEPAGTSQRLGSVAFRMEAYRLPRFEVQLHGPDRASLDREFEVELTATYYAGGRVAARPVSWRVTQLPYTWEPARRPGFFYSSDGRFARTRRFESTPALERRGITDEDGAASLLLNPAIEPTAQPRTYVVEATVVGADDQTVTATRRVVALPPFVVGLEVPRYLERAETIRPQIIVAGGDGELVAGQEITVRLLQRQWHSHLQASDFSDGVARYVTDVVDEPVLETSLVSGGEPLAPELPITEAGVYIVEVEARDRLGRAQVVAVDLFAGGEEAVTWSRPTTGVFSVAAEKERYRPGETAHVVLESPFQSARALAIVEAPEGVRYQWLTVSGGKASLDVPILGTYTPRLPVHFLLMRGRLEGTGPLPGSATDLGRPATLGATAWLEVEPVDNRLEVELAYPQKAMPGDEVEVGITLRNPAGEPLGGEVTLWLVDQAVLALGKEQRLDPLPDFITPVRSHLAARDTRGLVFGLLPFAERPGGGVGEEAEGILDRQTVRRSFEPVPYYNPAIQVGADGTARVKVRLPDDLTNFKLRAKAVSGSQRFGYATGHLAVRLPVIVQPALPRFVRPGDRFVAAAIGRIVEGEAGPGRAEMRGQGLILDGDGKQSFVWVPNRPRRVEVPVSVPTPAFDGEGRLTRSEVVVQMAVERLSDGAGDAFEVRLPLRDDRQRVLRRELARLAPDAPLEVPDAGEAVRPGSLRRSVFLSQQPSLVHMAAGLSFLLDYPYGCTEQRVSRARAQLALRKFRDLLHQEGDDAELDRAVMETLTWISETLQPNGLVAYWPGSPGYVSLTAWAAELMVEAREAGYPVDEKLLGRLIRSLQQALRSDYRFFIDGEAWAERTMALEALAAADRFDPAYGAELARRAQFLNLEGVAAVALAFDRSGEGASPALDPLVEELWNGIVVRLHQGREIYGGLQDREGRRNGLILPSETRTLATMTRALTRVGERGEKGRDERLQLLVDALITLGRGDGWGSTNANAEALLALAEILSPEGGGGRGPRAARAQVHVRLPGVERSVELAPSSPTAYLVSTAPGPGLVSLDDAPDSPVLVRTETSYLPAADGSQAAARRDGFLVTRQQLQISPEGRPPLRVPLETPGTAVELTVGQVVEDHVQVVNPGDRYYVAVVVPLAAGMEPLNPNLATAPPEARPSGRLTLAPTYAAYLDDHVAFYYNALPQGTYDFYFRTRATVPGSFIQPGARAEMMYDTAVVGSSAGARIEIARGAGVE